MPSASPSATTATATDDSHEGIHLVVLQHGLWGNASHVKFIQQQFKQRLGDRLCVYRARANESKFTYDGIDLCATRLVEEIHAVIKVIEEGGSIEDMKGQKNSKKKQQQKPHHDSTSANSSTASSYKRKVTQFSYMGYSLGGLMGRFAMGLLEMQKFFSPTSEGGRGIEPVYFVTMATPHLGIRTPSQSRFSRLFNYLSARMLSRTGEQLQLVDSYIPPEQPQQNSGNGKSDQGQDGSHPQQQEYEQSQGVPILVAMSEPSSVFMQALARFKKRALYCNIRNDRSVPFWTASFSDADPFQDLETLDIQYHSEYSSLIESFEHLEQALRGDDSDTSDSDPDSDHGDTVERAADDNVKPAKTTNKRRQNHRKKKTNDAASDEESWRQQLLRRIESIPWKRYLLFGVLGPFLLPIWIVIASSAISFQGLGSRVRTKTLLKDPKKLKELEEIRQSVLEARQRSRGQRGRTSPSGSKPSSSYTLSLIPVVVDVNEDRAVVIEQQQEQQGSLQEDNNAAALASEATATATTTTKPRPQDTQDSLATLNHDEYDDANAPIIGAENEEVSFCYPHLKTIRPLNLLAAQKEIARNMNGLEWIKNIVHIDAFNAHASIVVREKRFLNGGGVAAVQHAVDMFKQDGEDV